MAVFLSNVCKFNSCGREFGSLNELIRHIEIEHIIDIDYSPEKTNQRDFLPVSRVLRICSSEDDLLSLDSNSLSDAGVRKALVNPLISSPAVSLSTTPTDGSELDGEDAGSDSGQSIDSWATSNAADSTTNPLAKFHQIMNGNPNNFQSSLDSPNCNSKIIVNSGGKEQRFFLCGYNGCTKQYRNSNSLSHHRRSAHKIGGPCIKTPAKSSSDDGEKLKCNYCNRLYKTSHGLKNHKNIMHKEQMILDGLEVEADSTTLNDSLSGKPRCQARQVKQEPQQQVSSNFIFNTSTIKSELPTLKESLLDTLNFKSVNNATIKLEKQHSLFNGLNGSELIPAKSCPPVSISVEVSSEPKSSGSPNKCPPIISAPTLQQHLLSPIVPKMAT